MLDYYCTKKQGVINVCESGQGLTKKYFNTLVKSAKYMSHGEKCVICNGDGKIVTDTLKLVKKVPKTKCHGCDGKGWVTIHDRTEWTYPQYPQWQPYFPTYPYDPLSPTGPVWCGTNTGTAIDPNSGGGTTAPADWSVTANSGSITGDLPWIDFGTVSTDSFSTADSSGNTIRFTFTAGTDADTDFGTGGWIDDNEKKKGK